MKSNAVLMLALFFVGLFFVGKQAAERKDSGAPRFAGGLEPVIGQAAAFAASEKVTDLAPVARPDNTSKTKNDFSIREIPGAPPAKRNVGILPANNVPDVAEKTLATPSGIAMPPVSLSFDGLSNFDNIAAFGAVIIPPDMIGDVGPDHYVQAVKALVRVFDKNGNPLTAPFKMSQLFAPLGTPCSARDDGEPVVLYDPLADRWLLSQYCTNMPPFRQMIAISKTGDPTGAYFLYEFVMPSVRLNDFPKFGVWPDAYYMSTDEFSGSDYAG